MAKIYPFRAVRPSKENLHNFSSKSYSTYSKTELKNELDKNPASFLSIINIKKDPVFNVEKSKRYELVRKKYEEYIASKILIKDPSWRFTSTK